MEPLYDGNFSPGVVGHDASYMQLVEAYQIKKQIDQQAFNTLAIYNTVNNDAQDGSPDSLPDPSLTPALDFYDEYVWSSRGAIQEVKHTYTTTYEEVVNDRQYQQLHRDVFVQLQAPRGVDHGAGYSVSLTIRPLSRRSSTRTPRLRRRRSTSRHRSTVSTTTRKCVMRATTTRTS